MFVRLKQSAGLALLGAASLYAALPSGVANAENWPDIVEAKQIAEEAFIYGKPIVMNYAVMYQYAVDKTSSQYKAPFNQIKNEHRVFTYKDTAVISPNSDTPYSLAFLDLRAEPIVLSVPAVEKDRYYVVQMVDGSTYNYGYVGSRATGSEAGDYMIVSPGWQGEAPNGIKKVFRSGSDFSLLVFRTQLLGPDDMPNVEKVQAGYKVQPLSSYLNVAAAPAAPVPAFPKADEELIKANFFEYLDFALQFIPPAENETEIRAKLAKIGVGPGKSFDFKDLPLGHRIEIGLGMKDGEAKIDDYLANQQYAVHGWKLSNFLGDAEFFDGDWLKRAAGATAGIYGNSAIEAVYPNTLGVTLDASQNNFTLTFPSGKLPPVNAFWSVTMYNHKQLLIENPINRYLINSPMLPNLKKGEDGSLTIYIQKDSPGADKESNWLPAPDGKFYLALRMYWPKTGNPSILPVGKGTWSPPAIQVAQ